MAPQPSGASEARGRGARARPRPPGPSGAGPTTGRWGRGFGSPGSGNWSPRRRARRFFGSVGVSCGAGSRWRRRWRRDPGGGSGVWGARHVPRPARPRRRAAGPAVHGQGAAASLPRAQGVPSRSAGTGAAPRRVCWEAATQRIQEPPGRGALRGDPQGRARMQPPAEPAPLPGPSGRRCSPPAWRRAAGRAAGARRARALESVGLEPDETVWLLPRGAAWARARRWGRGRRAAGLWEVKTQMARAIPARAEGEPPRPAPRELRAAPPPPAPELCGPRAQVPPDAARSPGGARVRRGPEWTCFRLTEGFTGGPGGSGRADLPALGERPGREAGHGAQAGARPRG